MSGGSYDYLYSKMYDMADGLINSSDAIRRAFGKRLKLFADACHDIEWVDSGDCSEGFEIPAIEKALGENEKALILDEVIERAIEVKAQLDKAIKDVGRARPGE
jgi:long-subunit acyl-CoA synthetase (AMP-forming)